MRLSRDDINTIKGVKDSIAAAHQVLPTLPQLSARTGLSESKIKFGFKKIYGLSIHQFFHQQRMEHAMNLLRDDNKKLFAIAKAVGYKHLSTFVTAFKKHYGQTPGSYRNDSSEE